MARFVEIDRCPVPVEQAPAINAIRARSGAHLTSCYRGDDPEGAAILRKNAKSNQAQLYACDQARRRTGKCPCASCNPANPPKQSTHECFSDGVAYRGPRGRKLDGWQCGDDWDDSDAALAAALELGLTMVRPYADGREHHHTNFVKEPKLVNWLLPLQVGVGGLGARGVLVLRTVDRLHRLGYLHYPLGQSHYRYTAKVATAVSKFQKDHGLEVDGVVGPHTYASLRVVDRANTARVRAQAHTTKEHVAAGNVVVMPPTTTSHKGLDLIREFEGCYLYAYNDPVGYATVGIGHLLHYSRVSAADAAKYGSSKATAKLTLAGALKILAKDLAGTERQVLKLVKVPVTHGQFDALVSFTFNCGAGALATSTLLRKLNARDYQGAADEFRRWNRGGGQVLAGLTRRRAAERALFLSR